jgi:transposase
MRPQTQGVCSIERALPVFPTNDRLLEAAKDLPEAARPAVDMLADQLRETQDKIDDLTARIEAAQKADPLARRLAGLRPFTPRTVHRTVRRVPRTGAHSRDRRGDSERDRGHDARGRQLSLRPRLVRRGNRPRLAGKRATGAFPFSAAPVS